jgi:hypothetical protein
MTDLDAAWEGPHTPSRRLVQGHGQSLGRWHGSHPSTRRAAKTERFQTKNYGAKRRVHRETGAQA